MRWLSIGLFVGGIAWTLGVSWLQLRGLGSPEAIRVALCGAALAAVGGAVAMSLRARGRAWLRPLHAALGLGLAAAIGLAAGGLPMVTNPAVAALWRAPDAPPAKVTRRPTTRARRRGPGPELMLDRQTRRVVAEPGTPYRATPPAQAVTMLVGLGARGTQPPAGRVTMARAGDAPHVVFEGALDDVTRWHDVTLALDAGDATPIELRVEGLAGQPSSLVVSEPAFVRAPNGLVPRNLILVSLDTVRADALGTYGEVALPTSPALDALAARGTVFERCFSPAPWTTPAHMGLLTGIQPDALGLARVTFSPRIDHRHTTLAELFRDAAYLTVAFTGGATMAATHGFSDGFYFQQEAYNQQKSWQRDLDTNAYLALDWLAEHRREPLFLFFHTFEPHDPYVHQRFMSADVAATDGPLVSYLSGVAYTDDGLGRFLEKLEALGLLADSIVVVTSDHGDGFGAFPRNYHGKTLYDEVLHVPLIMAGPGIPAGRRIEAQVPLIDVYATLAELFGLAPPSEVDSRSLMPLVRGESEASRPVHLCCISPQQERGPDGKVQLKTQLLGLRRDGFKYVVSEDGRREELYDLTADPEETHNLADTYGATTRAMRRDVIAHSERAYERAAQDLADTKRELDADYAARLRALGYLD